MRLTIFQFVMLFLLTALLGRSDEVVRIMAANTTSGNNQSYDLGHGNRIFEGLDPDIVLVQEMNVGNNTPADYRAWVNGRFGSGFSYHVESGKSIPNGIVSRYPIIETGVWDDSDMNDREFVWARIDLPGDMNLLAVSVHLKASSGSANVNRRRAQAAELVDYIQAEKRATDHVVIGGDMNTHSRTEACLDVFSAVVVTSAPWPADQAGNSNTNSGQTSPYDWVMPGSSLAALSTPLKVGPNTHANGLVFDSRDYTPLSSVAPVQLGDSGAQGMQHMAVMRAFLIPTNEPPVITAGNSVSVTLSRDNSPVPFQRSLSAMDADGDTLSWSVLTPASHGSAGIVAPSTGGTVALRYTPTGGYTGSDSFVVRVSDGNGGTATITVNLTIQPPPNTAPVIAQGAVVAVTMTKNGYPDAFALTLSATDGEEDPLVWAVAAPASHGTAGIAGTGNSRELFYQPGADYVGTDSFSVAVSDGRGGSDEITVNVTIASPPAYDGWTHDAFAPLLPETEVTVWGDEADPDGDGRPNLEEFAQGTDPKTPDAPVQLLRLSREDGQLVLSQLTRMDGEVPALDYEVEAIGNLSAGWSSPHAGELVEEETVILGPFFQMRKYRVAPQENEGRRFFRLTVGRDRG